MYFIAIIFGVAGMLISWRLKSKFKTYSQTPLQSNLSGQEIAEQMLADHGITDVRVISVEGRWQPTNVVTQFNTPELTLFYSSVARWFPC